MLDSSRAINNTASPPPSQNAPEYNQLYYMMVHSLVLYKAKPSKLLSNAIPFNSFTLSMNLLQTLLHHRDPDPGPVVVHFDLLLLHHLRIPVHYPQSSLHPQM